MREIIKDKNIRNKILFTLLILFIFRIGSALTVPGVDVGDIAGNSIFSTMNLLGGGALERMSIFAMGVGPYITASIIIQLLSMDVIPALTEWKKSGEDGRKKTEKATQYLGAVLSMIQAFSMTYGFDKQYHILETAKLSEYFYTATLLTAGTMFLVWLGGEINQKGIGNGLSMIIFAGIVSSIPSTFYETWSVLTAGEANGTIFNGVVWFTIYLICYLAIILGVVIMETAIRKIPIQPLHSSAMNSGGNINYLPLKLNNASVIPVIFAQSVMTAPQIIISFFNTDMYTKLSDLLSLTKPLGLTIYAILIVLFTFFYTELELNPEDIAKNLTESGAFIPGIRQGSETVFYIRKTLRRLTVIGSFFLMILALIPYVLSMVTNLSTASAIGGTGVILIVGIAMETIRSIEGMLTEKKYKYTGFKR